MTMCQSEPNYNPSFTRVVKEVLSLPGLCNYCPALNKWDYTGFVLSVIPSVRLSVTLDNRSLVRLNSLTPCYQSF